MAIVIPKVVVNIIVIATVSYNTVAIGYNTVRFIATCTFMFITLIVIAIFKIHVTFAFMGYTLPSRIMDSS